MPQVPALSCAYRVESPPNLAAVREKAPAGRQSLHFPLRSPNLGFMMDQEIIDFIAGLKVATVACAAADAPYCFNCYYAFLEPEGLLVYKSSFNTRHEAIMQQNRKLAGTIIPEQIDVATIRGIQFEGMLKEESLDLTIRASAAYYLRFPFAMAVPGKIYVIELQSVKFTDNTKGFGHKQHWQR